MQFFFGFKIILESHREVGAGAQQLAIAALAGSRGWAFLL